MNRSGDDKKNKRRLKGYDTRKYMCKLLFAYTLNATNLTKQTEATISSKILISPLNKLLNSKKLKRRRLGYVCIAVFLNEYDMVGDGEAGIELRNSIAEWIIRDLKDSDENVLGSAVIAMSNLTIRFTDEQARTIGTLLQDELYRSNCNAYIRKKTAICLISMSRQYPDVIAALNINASEKISTIMDVFMNTTDQCTGIQMCLSRFFLRFMYSKKNASEEQQELEIKATKMCINMLHLVVVDKPEFLSLGTYNTIPCPWLTINLIRTLIFLPVDTDEENIQKLDKVFQNIISEAGRRNNNNSTRLNLSRKVISIAILLEVFHYLVCKDNDPALLIRLSKIMKTITTKQGNHTYLASVMNMVTKLVERTQYFETVLTSVEAMYQSIIDEAVNDPDDTITKSAICLRDAIQSRRSRMRVRGILVNEMLVLSDIIVIATNSNVLL
jgi:hypothetical protein